MPFNAHPATVALLKSQMSQKRVYSDPLQQLLQRPSKYTEEQWTWHILFSKTSSYWAVIEGKTTMNGSWERIAALIIFYSLSPRSFSTFSRKFLCSVFFFFFFNYPHFTQPSHLQVISCRKIFWNHFLLSSNLSTERTLNPSLTPAYLGMETLYLSDYTH